MNDTNKRHPTSSRGVPADRHNPYRAAACRFAAALLEYGRDHYGAVHTPLFVHMIDLRTLEIPRQRTPAEWRAEMSSWNEDRNYLMWGKDRSSVGWAQDSNLLWDTEAVRLFYAISADCGDHRFAAAADEYLRYFLRHCVSRTTSLFAWGEHVAYNVVDDRIHGERHELQHADPLWEELWRLSPDAVVGEIEGIYRCHITDKRSMAYDRHANYLTGLPERDQATILGYNGIFADAFAFLYRKTRDPKYQEWARRLMLWFQSKSDEEGLYPENWTELQAREQEMQFPARPSLASAMYAAFELTQDDRWLDDANRYLLACARKLLSDRPAATDPVFDRIGMAEAGVRGYRLTGDAVYLDIASREGDALIGREQPRTQMASSLAGSIEALLGLYEATGEKRWLDAARGLGDHALRTFIHTSGLIRGTAVVDRPDYYDAIQGPGALALALYRLGGMRDECARPADYIACAKPVLAAEISEWNFPEEASCTEGARVSVRITAPGGVGQAILHYARGNEIGFTDDTPTVDGERYDFHIAPNGQVGDAEVSFAVEAFGAGATRTISPWRRLRLFSEEIGRYAGGGLRFEALGLRIACPETADTVTARVAQWLPSGTAAPQAGYRSVGRYLTVNGAPHDASRLTVNYAPEDTSRLIETTLALAYWDGSAWVRVPSELDLRRRTVSARLLAAPHWTLTGEDRVLWRAAGRETGPALVDIEDDETFHVVTTFWQPGELLSPKGEPLRRFPIDPPYHPINNRSAPAAARLSPDEPLLLLFGAPSGYVYAYEIDGTLRWRSEVGGEIIGALAVGPLTGSADLGVVASWNGGVAAFDAEGREMWMKSLPEPSGTTPVLVSLDDSGRLDVVVNAGSRLITLRGNTGESIWEFAARGRRLTTPTVGAFLRGGPPRIVCGDDCGGIYALDENGGLLWKQNRLFGPREVPEPVPQYAGIAEVGLADLHGGGERQVVVTTNAGETVALSARGERLWRFTSYERKVGISLALGGYLGFADLDDDGELEVIVSQQDSYLYVLGADGQEKWSYRGYFWYHMPPAIADLQNTGELDIVFTAPEENGTYALRSGVHGRPGRAPWPMARGNAARTNCAPW